MWNESLVFSLADSTSLTVTGADIWQGSLTIEQSVSTDGMFEIGSTHVGQMSVSLIGISDSIDFTDAVVTVSMSQGSDALQQIGVYTVVRAEHDNGIISITAYDNMNNLSEPYTTALVYPSTYGAMVAEIVGTTIQFDGSTTAVQTAPTFEPETTKREVLGYIAQACGYNVRCDANGNYEFVRYNMSGFSVQGAYHEISSLFDFHHSHYPVVITGAKVIVRTTVTTTDPDTGETTTEEVVSTYTPGTDDYQIVIENNPVITTANGQLVANTIFATFGGVEFYTGAVSHISDLSIKASDIMKVTDRTGTTYPMLVSSTIISTGSPQTSQSYAEEAASKYVVQPSIIDRVQTSVRQALLDAKNGQNKANYAARIASNTNQYFWHTESGTDTGAHITEIPQEDFLADPANGGGNLLARSNGIAVRNGLTELATFGSNGSTIGEANKTHLEMDYHSIQGIDRNGNTYFYVSDMRDASGVATIGQTFLYDGTNTLSLNLTATAIVSVTINGVATSNYTFDGSQTVTLTSTGSLSAEDVIVVTYTTTSQYAKAYTLGNRDAGASVGPLSVAFGNGVEATGYASIASGYASKAYGSYALALGSRCAANGLNSFAGGGSCKADGNRAFAYGYDSQANGYVSVALGGFVKAVNNYSTAIGRYNDDASSGLFCVGNGTSDNARSNAFVVNSSGDAIATRRVTAGAVQSYTPTWSSGHTPADYHCVVSAGICSFSYRGPAIAHSDSTQIGTLPVGARPTSAVYCPFVKMGGGAVGCIRIQTTGVITVLLITDTSSTGRLYFNCTFPVV